MATSLTVTQIKASVGWDYENVLALGNSANVSSFSYSGGTVTQWANGTAINQADRIYAATGTLTVSGGGGPSLTVTLTSLADFFGNSLSFLRVKLLYFENQNTGVAGHGATSVSVGNATNAVVNWVGANTSVVNVRLGGCLFLAAPDATAYAVTASTGDQIKFLNTDASNICDYKVVIIGASA